jgi:hypothetical protein
VAHALSRGGGIHKVGRKPALRVCRYPPVSTATRLRMHITPERTGKEVNGIRRVCTTHRRPTRIRRRGALADTIQSAIPETIGGELSPAAYRRLLSRIMAVEEERTIDVRRALVVLMTMAKLPGIQALGDELRKLNEFDAAGLEDRDDITRADPSHGLRLLGRDPDPAKSKEHVASPPPSWPNASDPGPRRRRWCALVAGEAGK